MDIYSDTELRKVIMEQVIYPMQKEISKRITDKLKEYIHKNAKKNGGESTLSTRTMRKYTTYQIEKKGDACVSTIYIDDDAMQDEAVEHKYGMYSKFMSLGLETDYKGQSISYWLVSWLEETEANGLRGNNPIPAIHMFENTYKEIESLIPTWVKELAERYGV